ncbi:DEKNAAC104408 [Brettanomyces naardenensis]|uniref:DEKNAAC104408 n=1 Tax=Brettanomyces naardenensis TaxID=13370 RepID=A0A448YR05_BRENA|nr:DEKNAAC104408 [Brettanomyces naardenensis]
MLRIFSKRALLTPLRPRYRSLYTMEPAEKRQPSPLVTIDPKRLKLEKKGRGRRRRRRDKNLKRLDPDMTTADGVLTKFIIPELLQKHKIAEKDVMVNDGDMNHIMFGEVVEDVEVIGMDVRGDGIAVISVMTGEDPEGAEGAEGADVAADLGASITGNAGNASISAGADGGTDGGAGAGADPHPSATDASIDPSASTGAHVARSARPVRTPQSVVCLIPFALPSDIVKIRLIDLKRVISGVGYVNCDLLSIQTPSPLRIKSIPCKYFGICSGCQLQSISYKDQLELKRQTIVNAYHYLTTQRDITVEPTVGSPLLTGYRTKLTPHYDMGDMLARPDALPNIGFEAKGRPEWRVRQEGKGRVVDIEDCIIGTNIVRQGMRNERHRLANLFDRDGTIGKKGATLLLRENTLVDGQELEGSRDEEGKVSQEKTEDGLHTKVCVTDHNSVVNEYVNGLRFTFLANEFFQNNNSILPLVIEYVQGKLNLGSDSYLVDAYCGSGLFSIASAKSVKKVKGVEISAQSIRFAKKNAEINQVENCEFIQGKAERLFEEIDFPRDQTSVILDPPRKGCDKVFLDQLSEFEPKRIVYVSCNVHSQARDVERFFKETKNGGKYEIESVRGFDFFPQTYHVESVIVLQLAE